MLTWTLFALHKLLMVYIAYSSVRIFFGYYKLKYIVVTSGFLITQAIFGLCIVTSLENIVRVSEGFATSTNLFILHNIISPELIPIARIIFAIVGVGIVGVYYKNLAGNHTALGVQTD